MTAERVTINVDGASRGNPGPAAIGAVIKDEQGKVIWQIAQCIGIATNNQAEYQAVITALRQAIRLGARQIDIKLDSELIERQVSGRYRVRNIGLKPLFDELRRLMGCLEAFTVTHVPRQQNAEAHHLADRALRRLDS